MEKHRVHLEFIDDMQPVKRGRDHDEEVNLALVKRTDPDDLSPEERANLLEEARMLSFYAAWNTMTPAQKQQAAERIMQLAPQNLPFMGLVPPGLQKQIAQATPGTLMKLARVNKFFYAVASDDEVWKMMFARDYPNDFAFCRGNLPFFVLTVDHPFYVPGCIYEFERMPWKRFYLTLETIYRRLANIFFVQHKDHVVYRRHGYQAVSKKPIRVTPIPPIDTERAGARDIYHWYLTYGIRAMVRTDEEPVDRLASLVWLFICAFVALTHNGTIDSRNECVRLFWQYARERKWMWKYLVSMAGYEQYHHIDRQPLQSIQGPNFGFWSLLVKEDAGGQDKDSQLFEEVSRLRVKRDMLFSADDRKDLQALLTTGLYSNILFPSFEELLLEERTVRIDGFLKFWDLLAACTAMPCLLSSVVVSGGPAYSRGLMMGYLALYGQEVKAQTREFLNTLDGSSFFNPFPDWRWPNGAGDWLTPLLGGNPNGQRQLDAILYPWSPGNWAETIAFLPESQILNRNDPSLSQGLKRLLGFFAIKSRSLDGRLAYIEHPLCIQCGLVPEEPMRCGGICQDPSVVYCNADCQRAHWHAGGHSDVCGKK